MTLDERIEQLRDTVQSEMRKNSFPSSWDEEKKMKFAEAGFRYLEADEFEDASVCPKCHLALALFPNAESVFTSHVW